MAANTLKYFILMTGFVDIEIAPAIKPTPQNKGQNDDPKSRLNGRDLRYMELTKLITISLDSSPYSDDTQSLNIGYSSATIQ